VNTFNVVDRTMTQEQYMSELRSRADDHPIVIRLPWRSVWWGTRILEWSNRNWFRSELRVPSPLRPSTLQAKALPLRYSSERLRTSTGWQPRYEVGRALDMSVAAARGTQAPQGASTS
jgi:hypothetical protein